jgi:hypothetical protein
MVAALGCIALVARGQGQVNFNNTAGTMISTNATHLGLAQGPTQAYPGSGGPQFVYALFAAPSTVTTVTGVTDANWTFTGLYATNSTTAGRLIGGKSVLPAPYASGTTYNFIVRGWSSNIAGMDWPTVQTYIHEVEQGAGGVGLFGTSVIATIGVGGPPNPVPNIFGTTLGTSVQGFTLDQLPAGGTIPNFSLSIRLVGTDVQISVPTTAGDTYSVEYQTNLFSDQWDLLQSFVGDGTTNIVSDSITNCPGRFYRGVAQPKSAFRSRL